jgi:hypothetical protein
MSRKGNNVPRDKCVVRTSLNHLKAYKLESLLLESAAKQAKVSREVLVGNSTQTMSQANDMIAYLLMMSPTRPRWTASGLIMMKVCSRAAMLMDIARLC